ncbi:hypothetical protein [Streptomyces siamensis]|uniref:hypothetical protein n=1 Tax=Streptomyces siamensis TaxID=1274986 RepID=UPI0031E7686B
MRRARDVHDELRAGLRDAAEAHEPDRAHILARVERGMAGVRERRPARRGAATPLLGWVRVVGATAAVAGVLAAGGYAVARAVRDEAPQRTVAVSPPPEPSPDTTVRPPATGSEDGPLRSDGSVDPHSNDFWAQSSVTVRTSRQLTALTVRLRIRQTGGVSCTGAWRSLPEDDFTTTVRERDGFLVYTWVLKPGRTVWPGEWVFAGQYDHERGGRDAKGDRYTAAAVSGGERSAVAGGFAVHADDGAPSEGTS